MKGGLALTPLPQRERRFVLPGHLFVASQPTTVTTILGSCVSACMWDPMSGIGGINHFMLPLSAGDAEGSPRYGNVAMEELFQRLLGSGARRTNLRSHVFGGAYMFGPTPPVSHLGQKNAELALNFLNLRGVDIVEIDVGGNRGRKLTFDTDGGSTCLTLI